MNRRDFLRAGALTADGLYVAPDLLAEPRRKIFPVGIDLRPRVLEVDSCRIACDRTEIVGSARLPHAILYGHSIVYATIGGVEMKLDAESITFVGDDREHGPHLELIDEAGKVTRLRRAKDLPFYTVLANRNQC